MPIGSPEKSWWETFRSVLVTGAEIAVKVLPILLAAAQRSADGRSVGDYEDVVETGPIAWDASAVGGKVRIRNIDHLHRTLTVTFTPEAGTARQGEGVALEYNEYLFVDQDLKTLVSGQISVTLADAPDTVPARTGEVLETMVFSVGLVAADLPVLLLGDLVFLLRREADGSGTASLTTRLPLHQVHVTAANPVSGTLYQASSTGNTDANAASDVESAYTVAFPPGLVSENFAVVKDCVIELHAPQQSVRHTLRNADGRA